MSSVTFPPNCGGTGPNPPHLPSLSPIADTVKAYGLLAGVVEDASFP